ncbi:MAG: penicillin-binding protein 1A [Saccharospirillum sp.]
MKYLVKTATFLIWVIFSLICAVVLISASVYLYLVPSLPEVETLRDIKLETPMRVVSADNQLIAEFGEQRRTPLTYDQVPRLFVKALLAVEDSRFEEHHGVDPIGFTRAVATVIATGEIDGPGGSTLTQQVARNFFLTRDKTITRKFTEILLAFQMERELTKEEIFELYINKHFLGHRSYGIQAAANVYYGRDISDLTLAELAMIAGLHQAPSVANPISNPERALRRRNVVLSRMYETGYISEATYEQARTAPITARPPADAPRIDAAYLAEMVREYMVQTYGEEAYTAGYRVYTTLNSQLQRAANRGMRSALLDYTRRHGYIGPEQQFPLEASEQPDIALERWRDRVDQIPVYGGLRPAIVVRVEDDALWVLPRNMELTRLDFADMSWARQRITVNRMGPTPETAADIAQPGDLVRIEQRDGRWQLIQIPQVQGALVSLSPQDGRIEALVGGFDFNLSKYNRVVQASRQSGSTFKPFVYAAALDAGYTPASIVNDAPIVRADATLEDVWRPRNSGDRYLGPIPLRQALYQSRNLSSIRLLDAIGVNEARRYTERFGFDSTALNNDMTLVLGSTAQSPLSIARGYAVFANGGYLVEPYFIQSIHDANGNIIYDANPAEVCRNCPETPTPFWDNEAAPMTAEAQQSAPVDVTPVVLNLEDDDPLASGETTPRRYAPQVLSAQTAYLMDSMLKDVVRRGTGWRAHDALRRDDLAGKTGTTNDAVDAWFSGYNGQFVTTTWVGFDQPVSLGQNEFGGVAALPGWIEYMRTALDGQPSSNLAQPVGIVRMRIDPRTGLLARAGQNGAVFEIFDEDNVPTEFSRDDVTIDFSGGSNGTSSEDTIVPQQLF